ncbi:hypothetical protein A2767_04235 [Candidatus Roizmanbacteria bacterium RIFCSPHIGHO2_01_FULL_35_10]|nr:MAG: hypothetical protein A2767_04235 [Candidatus Roizmanbacteria bacterium RIFCSPHIGHO2_01_FULL_35_10]
MVLKEGVGDEKGFVGSEVFLPVEIVRGRADKYKCNICGKTFKPNKFTGKGAVDILFASHKLSQQCASATLLAHPAP